MDRREEIIRRWFGIWLSGKDTGLSDIFSEDAVYTESWGTGVPGREKDQALV